LRYASIQEEYKREREREEEEPTAKLTDLFTGRLTLLGPQTRCSSCLQLRNLGCFLTCEPCRCRNAKSNRRRSRTQNPNPPPAYAALTNHIQLRQQATGKKERRWAGYRAITVDNYIQEPTQEEEQELQDRQQRREDGKAKRRVWEGERKGLSRENYLKRGQPEGEFEA
jgi:hypothetical protein